MSVHLTVDLDFWHYGDTKFADREKAEAFMRRVVGLKLPIHVVIDHDLILPTIKRFDAKYVINIDEHDDVTDMTHQNFSDAVCKPDEGTWANFLEDDVGYEWRYPYLGGYNCDGCGGQGTWCSEDFVKQWTRFKKVEGLGRIPWGKITSVSVTLSPSYVDLIAVAGAVRVLGESGLVYGTKVVTRALKAAVVRDGPIFRPRDLGLGIYDGWSSEQTA